MDQPKSRNECAEAAKGDAEKNDADRSAEQRRFIGLLQTKVI